MDRDLWQESEDLRAVNPSRDGYTFVGWSGTGINGRVTNLVIGKGSTGNRAYTANWEKITGVSYKVRHLREDLNGNYTIEEVEEIAAEAGETVSPAVKVVLGLLTTIESK